MQYHDILLPDSITVHLKGGPGFSTTTASTISGREIRFCERQNAIQKYRLEGCRLSQDEFQRFNSFFRARIGCAYAFRIRDHADFKIENQIIGTADGISKEFEIYKSYEDYVCSYKRKIACLREETIEANFAIEDIDRQNGLIRTQEILEIGKTLIINAEFDVWVRFVSDEFLYSSCADGSILIEDLDLLEVL
jgi:uncharacterized protein (TIGR02217 family)